MAARDLFKTKLCTLYARGSCDRPNCTFAHGEEELRKPPPGYSGSSGRYSGPRRGDTRDRMGYYDDDRRYSRRMSPSRRRGRSQSYSPSRDYPSERGYYSRSRSPSDSSEGRPRKRDRRGDYEAEYDGHFDSTERQDLEQERKMLLKDVTIQKEHRNTLQALLNRKKELASDLVAQMKLLEGEVLEKEGSLNKLSEQLKMLVDVHHRVTAAEEDVKKSQQRLQLALAEVSPEDLALVSSDLPKFVLEVPRPVPAKPKPPTIDDQLQDASRRQMQGAVRMQTGVPDRSKSFGENPASKPGSNKHPRNPMDSSTSDRDDHYGNEGQGRSGRKWQADGALKPRKPVEPDEGSARPDHRPPYATNMTNGSSGEALGRRWDSPDVAEVGEDQYAEREETRAAGKGIVLKFKDGEKKGKKSAEGEKEVEVKPKRIGEVTVIPKSANVLDSLSQAKWLKEERAALNRKADPGPRGRAREQPKVLRRHADDKGQEPSDLAVQTKATTKEEKAEPAAVAPEEAEKEDQADDGMEAEKKPAQTAEEKAKQEQIQQRQQELMEHIQKQIQERQKEEQLRQQLVQQQMAAEEAERRAMYEAAQMQQQQQLEQYYQQPHDQYQMPYADAYMMPAEQYPAEQVPEGYEVEEDEPPPGVTPENAPIFGSGAPQV